MSDNENKTTELNKALKDLWDSLTDEQKEKAKACKSMDELTALAARMGVELPDELLDQVAGGSIYTDGLNTFVLNDETYAIEGVGKTKHMDAILKFANDNGINTKQLNDRDYRTWKAEASRRGNVTPKIDIEEYYGLDKC